MADKSPVKLEFEGLEEIQKKLAEEIKKIKGNARKGVRAAAAIIKGEAQALTPVDDGILRNSAFFRTFVRDDVIFGIVGFTAFYAPYVHRAPMTLKGKPRADFGTTRAGVSFGGGSGKGFYWDGGENEFLEKAVIRNFPRIVNTIAKFAGK